MQIHIVLTKVVTIEFSRVSGMWFDMFENARMLADVPGISGQGCSLNLGLIHDTKHFETSQATWSSLWQSELEEMFIHLSHLITVSWRKHWMLICDCYACIR